MHIHAMSTLNKVMPMSTSRTTLSILILPLWSSQGDFANQFAHELY